MAESNINELIKRIAAGENPNTIEFELPAEDSIWLELIETAQVTAMQLNIVVGFALEIFWDRVFEAVAESTDDLEVIESKLANKPDWRGHFR